MAKISHQNFQVSCSHAIRHDQSRVKSQKPFSSKEKYLEKLMAWASNPNPRLMESFKVVISESSEAPAEQLGYNGQEKRQIGI